MSSPEYSAEDKDKNQQGRRQRKARRTRKDEQGRDFCCACGKSYLSYPALYTHIKTKHDGKVSSYLNKVPSKSSIPQDISAPVKEDLQQLKMFLQKYYPERVRATPISQLLKDLPIQQATFIKPILVHWQEDEHLEKARLPGQKTQMQYFCADLVFGKFLYDMNKRVNMQCIHFLCRFIIQLREGVLLQKADPKYCIQNTAKMVPSLFNDLILNGHIPSKKYGINNEKERVWQVDPIMQDITAVCKVMHYFSNWLYNNHYTDYTVKYRH